MLINSIFIALILGVIISIVILILPMGGSYIGVIMANVISNVLSLDNITNQLIIISVLFTSLILNSIKEVITPQQSGNEDILTLYTSTWQCMQIPTFNQIRNLVESKILGLIIGFTLSYILITVLHVSTGSFPITKLVAICILYKVYKDIEFKSYELKQDISILLVRAGMFLCITPILFTVMSVNNILNPSICIIYCIYMIPSCLDTIFNSKAKTTN